MAETPSLQDVTERALRMTDRMLAELERRMDAPAKEGAAEGLEHKSSAQFKALGTDLTKNVRALTGMLREARAQAKDAYALFKKMTAAQRNEAVVHHVRTQLSRDQKLDLVQELMRDVNGAT